MVSVLISRSSGPVRALARDIVLCSWVRHSTLTVLLRHEYFHVLFVNVFSVYFSVFIFLFVTKTIASLYKVLALMHIFTAPIIPPIVFIRIVLQSTHLLKIL